MSWESHYHPTSEAMEKYKPWKFDDKFYKDETSEYVRDAKLELLVYCLEDHSTENTHSIIKSILFHLKYIANTIEAEEKAFAYKRWKEEDGDLWYSGRNFEDAYETVEDIINDEVDMFVLFAKIIKTEDFFKEHSTFYEKKHELDDRIDCFAERISDRIVHTITEDLKEFYEDPYKSLKEELTD